MNSVIAGMRFTPLVPQAVLIALGSRRCSF
jgi:hypothetical protein